MKHTWQSQVTYTAGNETTHTGTYAAMKIVASLLHYLSQVQWLAKDVIWLVVDDTACSAQQEAQNATCSPQHSAKV